MKTLLVALLLLGQFAYAAGNEKGHNDNNGGVRLVREFR